MTYTPVKHTREASLVGSCIPRQGHGRVVSVHDVVVNVLLDEPAELKGRILSLVWHPGAMSDISVLVGSPSDHPAATILEADAPPASEPAPTHRSQAHPAPARDYAVADGMAVSIDVNTIRVENLISLSRHFARCWNGRPRPIDPKQVKGLATTINGLADSWKRYVTRTGMAPLLLDEPVDDPVSRKSIGHVRDHQLDRLVGLGIGFTPAGDDFISGLAFLLEWVGSEGTHRIGAGAAGNPDRWTPAQLRGGIKAALRRFDKTTTAGATLLWLVKRGCYPAYLHSIAHALASGRADHAIKTAISHGHTSGVDALTGMVWGWKQLAK